MNNYFKGVLKTGLLMKLLWKSHPIRRVPATDGFILVKWQLVVGVVGVSFHKKKVTLYLVTFNILSYFPWNGVFIGNLPYTLTIPHHEEEQREPLYPSAQSTGVGTFTCLFYWNNILLLSGDVCAETITCADLQTFIYNHHKTTMLLHLNWGLEAIRKLSLLLSPFAVHEYNFTEITWHSNHTQVSPEAEDSLRITSRSRPVWSTQGSPS